jgi:excisionase family DNA binding protein
LLRGQKTSLKGEGDSIGEGFTAVRLAFKADETAMPVKNRENRCDYKRWSQAMKRSANNAPGRAEPDMIMTVSELAVYLRVHATTIYRLLKDNKVPAFRVGSDWRFSRRAIDRWMLSQQKQ